MLPGWPCTHHKHQMSPPKNIHSIRHFSLAVISSTESWIFICTLLITFAMDPWSRRPPCDPKREPLRDQEGQYICYTCGESGHTSQQSWPSHPAKTCSRRGRQCTEYSTRERTKAPWLINDQEWAGRLCWHWSRPVPETKCIWSLLDGWPDDLWSEDKLPLGHWVWGHHHQRVSL